MFLLVGDVTAALSGGRAVKNDEMFLLVGYVRLL